MPTGYTSEIYDGKEINGKDFLIKCARGFGACISMRDDDINKEIPEEFIPDTYHIKALEETKLKLKKYQLMSNEDIQKEIDQEYITTIEYNKNAIQRLTNLKNRYLNTLAEIQEWIPPTDKHKELKRFAIEQITSSIKFDCNTSYYEKEVVKLSPKEWLDIKINRCLKDIEYHSEKNNDEIKHTKEKNKWIKDLRNSLNNMK